MYQQASYTSSTRNGVTTMSYSGFCGVNVSLASEPPPSTCSVPNKVGSTWTQGSASCQGDSQTASAGSTISNGQSFTVFDNTQYDTGSQTYLCSSGTVAMTSTSCTTAAPLNVTFNWLIGTWGSASMNVFSVSYSSGSFPISVSFTENYWMNMASPSVPYTSKEAIFGYKTWYAPTPPINQNATVCVGSGTYNGYNMNGVYPMSGSNCDLQNSAYGRQSGWVFAPGTYGGATLVVHQVHNSVTNYSGTGTANPNPSLSTNSAPITGGWTGNKSGTMTNGSFSGTLYNPGYGSSTVTFTNGLGQVISNSPIIKK